MKANELTTNGALIKTVFGIISDGIARDVKTIRVHIGRKHLEIFEKKGSARAKKVAFASRNLGMPIISRLKILGGLFVSEHEKVQSGEYQFHYGHPESPIKRRIGITSRLDRKGKEEVVVNLAP